MHRSTHPMGSLTSLICLATLACTPVATEPQGEPDPAPSPREPPPEPPAGKDSRLRTVYVPAYSHLPKGKDARPPALFAILLSVRNVDPSAVVTLSHVDYYDTFGHRVRRYLDEPRALRPLETAEFAVETLDEVGGSGANFLVYWEGPSDAHPLLTEAVMVGQVGPGHVGFTSRGVELARRPELPAAGVEPTGDAPSP